MELKGVIKNILTNHVELDNIYEARAGVYFAVPMLRRVSSVLFLNVFISNSE